MNIIKGYPPNYLEIEKALHPSKDFMFTYGDTIYWPMGLPIRQDVMVHEEVHMKQQSGFFMPPKRWWKKYLASPRFRFEQEVEAFQAQWGFIATYCKDREMRIKLLNEMARNLSNPAYGKIVSYADALQVIKGGWYNGKA